MAMSLLYARWVAADFAALAKSLASSSASVKTAGARGSI
jgi:hypothetical protein